MNVAYESGQPQQTQQTEYLCETDDPERTCRLVEIRIDPRLYNKEDVVHRNWGDEVYHEPRAQIFNLYLLRVQYNLRVVLLDDARAKVEHQIHEEEGVWDDVEDDPRRSVLVLEEGDANGDDDQVSHHQQQHSEIPVEPGQDRGSGGWNNRGTERQEEREDVKLQLWSHLAEEFFFLVEEF